jgi:eukaryotic-like serine/threonine-protein kinase
MPSSASFVNGHIIANKYRVEGILGRGAMGVVLAARHLDLRHLVAIKVLPRDVAELKTARERFLREARVAARIHSQHVCRVLDTGTMDDGTPFFVMEYLDGIDLCAELQQRGRLELTEAVAYIRQACEALTVAHGAGIVHRDLKPANLFLLGRTGRFRLLKVLDFGVSKALQDQGALTSTATLVGSPLYMSPEQLDCARDVDARSDLWSLGAILYELVTGEVPFSGNTLAQVVTAIVQREPASFASQGITLPAGLEDVIRRTLSKSQLERPASAAELSQALAPYGPSRAESDAGSSRWSESVERERATLDESDETAPTPQQLMAALRRAIVTSQPDRAGLAARSSRRRLWPLGALAGGLLLAAALLALRFLGTQGASGNTETQTSSALAPVTDAGSMRLLEPSEREEHPSASEPSSLPQNPTGIAPPVLVPPPADHEPADPPPRAELAQRKNAAPARAPAPEPRDATVRSIRPVVSIDPLEIPGFGGRH